jgi:ABC-type transport system substrate-binding protein
VIMRKILLILVFIIPLFGQQLVTANDSTNPDSAQNSNLLYSHPFIQVNPLYAQNVPEDSVAESDKAETDPKILTEKAHVVYQTQGRIYLDIGLYDGVNEGSCVEIITDHNDTTCVPLNWFGIDLCSFTLLSADFQTIEVGSEFNIRYISRQIGFPTIPNDTAFEPRLHQLRYKRFNVTFAYPTVPSWPHVGANNHYDREFKSLITEPLNRYVDIASITSEDERQNKVGIKIKPGLRLSDANPVRISDIIYSLQYCFDNPTQETFNLTYLEKLNDIRMEKSADKLYIISKISTNHLISIILSDNIPLLSAPDKFDLQEISLLSDSIISLSSFSFDSLPDPDYAITAAPYYIDSISDDKILLLRNEYHRNLKNHPQSISIRIIPDYLKRKLAFQIGEIDLLDLHHSDIGRFNESYNIEVNELSEVAYLTVNNRKDYLMDGILTTSLSYLINKKSLCRVALGKMAQPANSLKWPPEFTGNMYEYDPSKGRSLLKNLSDVPRYLSLYVNPDDFLSMRTADYIKGILERENIYATIYSDIDKSSGPKLDFFNQYDLMLGRIDLSLKDPVYLLNQICYHTNLADISLNRSLYLSENHSNVMQAYYEESDTSGSRLTQYYSILKEVPSGILLYTPQRSVVLGKRIKTIGFNQNGLIDFKKIEIANETER